MMTDDVPDAMVNSALSLDTLLLFLHENRDTIELSTTDIAMYIGALMYARNGRYHDYWPSGRVRFLRHHWGG